MTRQSEEIHRVAHIFRKLEHPALELIAKERRDEFALDIATKLVKKDIGTKNRFEIKDAPHGSDRGYDVWVEAIDYKEK